MFSRENPGFDAIVGNPPFLGGARISTTGGMRYFDFVTTFYAPAGHQCDLVGYFFRKAYDLIREKSTLGLIATNTIAQGDTRNGALVPILESGGCIYAATKRMKWPGMAAVIVCPVHISKQNPISPALLNSRPTTRISAYLFSGDVDESPAKLSSAAYFSKGSQIYGQGFVFDDTDDSASPLSLMSEILNCEPKAKNRILPFIGGQELNSQPKITPYRHVIYLSDIQTEEELDEFPRLASLIREKVKPERDILGDNPNNTPLKKRWWAYQAHRPELYKRLANHRLVLVHAEVGPYLGFQLVPTGWIYNKTMILIELESFAAFGVAQSRTHEGWARTFGSSLKDDLRYTASDCFETFPFPPDWETNTALELAGREYYEYRAALMIRNDEGLTKTYNRFHDPEERSPDIHQLRTLHAAMDRAVLAAYGWPDIVTGEWRAKSGSAGPLQPLECEFLLDYEEDEDESETTGKKRKKKKPYRYRWPDEVRDEVLARLLALNAERAEQERLSGTGKKSTAKKVAKKKAPSKKAGDDSQIELFPTSPVAAPALPADPWREQIAAFRFDLPIVPRPVDANALGYYRILIPALVQEAGGSVPWNVAHTAAAYWPTRNSSCRSSRKMPRRAPALGPASPSP